MKTTLTLAAATLGSAALALSLSSCVVDATTRTPETHTTVETYNPGHVISTLPAGYTSVTHRGVRYYQAGGVYYRPTTSGYTVVTSPF